MRQSGRFRSFRTGLAAGCVLGLLGCVPPTHGTETIKAYKDASDKLGRAADELFVHANTVAAESYIDTRTFDRQPLSRTSIEAQVILSDEGLRLRRNAIRALSVYTAALAEVASGKAQRQIAADAATAGTGVASLLTDLQAAIGKDGAEAQTTMWSGAVSAAAGAAGELVQLMERRHSRAALVASLRKNDPAMKRLFEMIGADAEHLYQQQQQAVRNRGDILLGSYADLLQQKSSDEGYVLALSDRIKRYRRDMSLLANADPAPAFAAWSKAHDGLVTLILDGGSAAAEHVTFKQLMAYVEALAAEVQPLATNCQTLAQSL